MDAKTPQCDAVEELINSRDYTSWRNLARKLETGLNEARAERDAMKQSRDEWKHRYGQMDDTRIAAEATVSQLRDELAQARAAIRDFVGFRVEAVFDHRGTYSERKMAELAAIKEKHAPAISAASAAKGEK